MSLFQELKRRNVFRVAIAYLAGAWLLTEVAGTIFPAFGVPEWGVRFVVLILALGFLPALVFSWVYELTPDGIKRERDVVREISISHHTAKRLDVFTIGIVVVAIGFIFLDRLWLAPQLSQQSAQQTDVSAEKMLVPETKSNGLPYPPKSVAVLPFANRSANSDDVFFVDGIHDDLLSHISKISAIKTISRTSVMRYRNSAKSIPEIAAELGVAAVLEGGIQRAGDQVRINVQLIDGGTDGYIWSEIYDRRLTAENIFSIQSEIARAVATALRTTLTPPEQKRMQSVPTKSLVAYEAYLLGRQELAKRRTDSLGGAVEYFRKALDLDPDFAQAWVGLADAHIEQAYLAGFPKEEAHVTAASALNTALELDSQLGEAYASFGYLNYRQNNLEAAGRFYDKALELSPNYAELHLWYSLFLSASGRSEESLSWRASAIELDPMSAEVRRNYAKELRAEGRFDEALEQLEVALEINPGFVGAIDAIATIQWQIFNNLDAAVRDYHRLITLNPNQSSNYIWLAQLYLDLGDPGRAGKLMERANALSPEFGIAEWGNMLLKLYDGKEGEVVTRSAEAFLADAYGADWHVQFCLSQLRNQALAENRLIEAREVYSQSHPELLFGTEPTIGLNNYRAAIDLASVLQKLAEEEKAAVLLERSGTFIRNQPRLGWWGGYWIYDVQILALQGKTSEALSALQQAFDEGWRSLWWYYLQYEPNLDSLREEPEFKAVVDKIKKDMAGQMEHVREMELGGEIFPFPALLIKTNRPGTTTDRLVH